MPQAIKAVFWRNVPAQIALALYVGISMWWILLHPFTPSDAPDVVHARYIWGSIYQVIALWGAIQGLLISKYWGGMRSLIGRAVLAFAIGLFLQVFGQTIYSYYNLFAQIQAPYPSIGDIGYFGSIFVYMYGVLALSKAAGVAVTLRSYSSQAWAVILPLLMLLISYWFFLRTYEYDWTQPLKIFLDFGYPFGQALYVSIAILALLLSRKILGGMMRGPVLAILVALIVQYCSDFNFLYQASQGTWFVGGYGDLLYATSYLLMTIALTYVGTVFHTIRES